MNSSWFILNTKGCPQALLQWLTHIKTFMLPYAPPNTCSTSSSLTMRIKLPRASHPSFASICPLPLKSQQQTTWSVLDAPITDAPTKVSVIQPDIRCHPLSHQLCNHNSTQVSQAYSGSNYEDWTCLCDSLALVRCRNFCLACGSAAPNVTIERWSRLQIGTDTTVAST